MCQGAPHAGTGGDAAMANPKGPAVKAATPAAEDPAAGAGAVEQQAAADRVQQTVAEAPPQQQQGPASSSQQDGSLPASLLQQQGSRQSGGSGGSLKRPRSSGGREESTVVVAGREVIGRQVAVWCPKLNDWPKATIAQFKAATQQHLVRYQERKDGQVKHHEEWVSLARLRFQWLSDPAKGASANPTYASAPRGDDAVHWRVKVFWPGMARWYVGKVTSYDPKTKKHSVRYRDGDTQELQLRNEAVQYLEREAAAPPKQQRPLAAADVRKGSDKGGDRRRQGGGAGGGPKKAVTGDDSRATGTKRQRDGSVGAGEEVSSGGELNAGAGDGKRKGHKSSSAAREEGGNGTPVAAPTTASPPKDAVAGSHDVSAVMMGDSEEGQVDSEGGTAPSDDMPSSSAMESEEEEEDLGSEVFISGLEEEEDSDFEVESVRNRRRGGNKAATGGGARSATRRSGTARSGSVRKDRRGGGGGALRRSRGPARSAPTAALRLTRRDSQRPGSATFRKVLRADEESIKAAGAGIVGARVSVFWHEDESYYKGKLVQFDGYHKRHKIVYDDGEEEWVSLPREAFHWLTPRARSAGCTPEFRHLMQQLGAEECSGPSGGVATRRQAQAGGGSSPPAPDGTAAGPRGEACVGWQVSVLFDGDGQLYRGEVVGWDPRRARALLLYDDGEDEWVALEREELSWHCQLAGHSGVYPGLRRGEAPVGHAALGWRVGVYWTADQAFYCGEIVGYDASSGWHEVAYDDGEEGPLKLGADRVKWILPPGAAVDREKLETAAEVRGRRRGGDESDPDYEVFEYRPRSQQVRRPFQRVLSDGLLPGPTLLSGVAGAQPWELVAGQEAWLADSGGTHPQRHPSLPFLRPLGQQGGEAAMPPPQHLGRPLVVRQMARVTALGLGDTDGLALPQPITVRIYMSGSANSGSSAASADTQAAAGGTGGSAAPPPRLEGAARLQARLWALKAMGQRVAKAQQTIVKGVPTPMPSRKQVEEAARAARGATACVTSPTAAQRQQQLLLGSSHASGLHRLARGSAVNYSPFHHKRPHPADSEASSSDSSDEEDGDTGADSAEARRAAKRAAAAVSLADPCGPSGTPLSPRSTLKGAKIKPLAEIDGDMGVLQQEGSTLSDGMLTAAPVLGQQSPAIMSPFKSAPACPPVSVSEGGLDGGLGSGMAGLLPSPHALGEEDNDDEEGGLAAMPRSSSLAGGMDALMMPLPLHALPRGDSMVHLLPLSHNASGMLGGTNSGLLGLDDGGTGSGLLGTAMDLDALQPEADAVVVAP